ncbi:hypothetical protein PIROE2DRAFT_59589 [Piromyces sp. E2]|nr:hypothetical protein PIROE2DRAFT_59589 [Piromyces sp. E2]|eukprot:OUM66141.1 hypothetical protein PIROE2DRAFT_59589 [Piromyces sp. E2]
MASSTFPSWLYDAKNLKELDISNTQMLGLPQRDLGNIDKCNFSNTPICSSFENSPYKDFVPGNCAQSCKDGGASSNVSNGSSSSSGSNNGGTKVWPYILIGVAALVVLCGLGFLLMKKKGKKTNTYEEYEANKPAPIPKIDNKKEKNIVEEEEPLEIAIDNEDPSVVSKQHISPFVASGPPTPASDLDNGNMEEVAINNYNNAYGGDVNNNAFNQNRMSGASAKDIYRHNQSNMSYDQDNIQTHPSLYNTMTTDNDSDDDEQDSKVINQPIVSAVNDNQQNMPTLLRRQSSKKQSSKNNSPTEQEYEPIESAPEEQYELYIANWDYSPTLSDELALVAGDVIEIKKKFDDGWCNGYNRRTNQSGIVPLCYLKEYED